MMRLKRNIVLTMLAASAVVAAINAGAQERDPFVSILDLQQQKMKVDLSGVVLKGIIWESSRPVAILNDTLVTVGDDFFGFKVVKIGKDKVTLTMGKESYVLEIESTPVEGKEGNKQEEDQPQKQASVLLPAPPMPDGAWPNEDPIPDIQR